ncbi:MAG TPA: FAD-linked oxidase C-terminal domain-containing protein [Thermoanaerobaculia bacterium]|nr:FAD-linked oxidase C-terminal domain-containing protein [Thermoanaerobaculia bacterium]
MLLAVGDLHEPVLDVADVPGVEPAFGVERLWKVRQGTFPSAGAARTSGTTVLIEDVAFPAHRLADAAVDQYARLIEDVVELVVRKYDGVPVPRDDARRDRRREHAAPGGPRGGDPMLSRRHLRRGRPLRDGVHRLHLSSFPSPPAVVPSRGTAGSSTPS